MPFLMFERSQASVTSWSGCLSLRGSVTALIDHRQLYVPNLATALARARTAST